MFLDLKNGVFLVPESKIILKKPVEQWFGNFTSDANIIVYTLNPIGFTSLSGWIVSEDGEMELSKEVVI